jgi:hypothetical protein
VSVVIAFVAIGAMFMRTMRRTVVSGVTQNAEV